MGNVNQMGFRRVWVARLWVAVAIDVLCILAFCALGRLSHDLDLTVVGVAETAWPFLVGAAAGWFVSFGWRRPMAVSPTGVTVWLGTVAVGMFLRAAVSGDVPVSFFLVTSAVTAILLIGWRILATLVIGRRGSPTPTPPP